MKTIIVGALPSSLVNFRGELISKLVSDGHSVIALASGASSEEVERVNSIGADYLDYPVQRSGLNPVADLNTLISLKRFFEMHKPDVLLAYTIKPIIWGGIAGRLAKVDSFYAMITGLGYAFQKGGFVKNSLNALVKFLYRIALKHSKGIIFQNKDNMNVFIDECIVPKEKCYLVNGSGVDLSHFGLSALPSKPRFLLIARLLGDKGIREFIKAAELVKHKYPDSIFELVGPEDSSPDGIKLDEIQKWCDKGVIVYSGATKDVRPYIDSCSIYVLPSYHEGMPRSVLEAMAMGRPILTTDVPGCRETVINGKNGWLVEKANVEQLSERMIWFIENQSMWQQMGKNSYDMACERFDVQKVNIEILKVMGLINEKAV